MLLSIHFFVGSDDFHAASPEGRKRVAQCASTGRTTVPPQPRNGAAEPTRRPLLSPRSGLGQRSHLLPTAVRRGLLSFALRALRAVQFDFPDLRELCPAPGTEADFDDRRSAITQDQTV